MNRSLGVVIVLSTLLLGACAKANFATRWSTMSTMASEDPNASESDRRESERRHEVVLLKAEKAEIAKNLDKLYHVLVARDARWSDGGLDWAAMTDEQRVDARLALERFLQICQRVDLLTGRDFSRDPDAKRASNLLTDLVAYKPRPLPYYAH